MCTVSMVMDYGRDKLIDWPRIPIQPNVITITQPDTRLEDFIKTLEEMLERAKQYDRDNNEPDCELDEKRLALKKIADELGVKIRFPSDV